MLNYLNNYFVFFKIYLKQSLISNTEYDPLGNSNSSFYVGADISNLLIFINLNLLIFIFLHV